MFKRNGKSDKTYFRKKNFRDFISRDEKNGVKKIYKNWEAAKDQDEKLSTKQVWIIMAISHIIFIIKREITHASDWYWS